MYMYTYAYSVYLTYIHLCAFIHIYIILHTYKWAFVYIMFSIYIFYAHTHTHIQFCKSFEIVTLDKLNLVILSWLLWTFAVLIWQSSPSCWACHQQSSLKKGKGRHKEMSSIFHVVQHGCWEWGITNICSVEN